MRSAVLMVALAVLTACGGAPPVADPPASAEPTMSPSLSASSEPSATASAAPTRATGVMVRVVEDHVVEPADGERYTNPGVVVEDDDGTLHLLRNSFSSWPGDSSVHHLTSTDAGLTWDLADPDPILTNDDVPYADRIAFVTSAVVEDDGSWTAYLYTYDGVGRRAVIGRATAPGPGGPWAVDPDPVLEPGDEGDWDGVRLAEPAVLRVDGEYRMWFVGFDERRISAIGYATSPDGVTWTKHDGPVLTGEQPWMQRSIDGPQVLRTDDGYLMSHTSSARGTYAVGLATSPDGVAWTPIEGNPVLNRHDVRVAFFQSELFRTGDHTRFLLEVATGDETTKLFLYDVNLDAVG